MGRSRSSMIDGLQQAANPRNTSDAKVERSVWDRVVDTASKYNAPGAFTVLNGYEYSSSPNGDNLHRVVVFRDGPDRVKQILPLLRVRQQ